MSLISQACRFIQFPNEKVFLFLGPISLYATLFVAMMRNWTVDLVVFPIIGLFLCVLKGERGLWASLLALVVASLFKHFFFLSDHQLWMLGIECSMAMGFLMCAFAVEHWQTNLHHASKNAAQTEINEKRLEVEVARLSQDTAQLNDRLEIKTNECAALLNHQESLRKMVLMSNQERDEAMLASFSREKEMEDSKEKWRQDYERLQGMIAEREADLNKIHSEIEGLEQEKNQSIALIEGLEQEKNQSIALIEGLEQEKNQSITLIEELRQEKNQSIALIKERMEELTQKEVLYYELKNQFHEKDRVLHRTRVELFQLDTKWQSEILAKELEKYSEPSSDWQNLSFDLIQSESNYRELENENAALSEWISDLLREIAPTAFDEKSDKEITASVTKKRRKRSAPKEEMEQKLLF